MGTDLIEQREQRLWWRALERWQADPNIEILGHPDSQRLSIVSFRIRSGGQRYLHHNFVVSLLNDLFGIQARGGCSCAGPYGHRLLSIDAEHSRAYRDVIELGCEGIKPGWTRINFNYFISETVRDYLIDAVELLGQYGHRLLPDYIFHPDTGLWHHRSGPAQPPLRLADLVYDEAGTLHCPTDCETLGEDALADHLRDARALMDALPDEVPRRRYRSARALRSAALVPATPPALPDPPQPCVATSSGGAVGDAVWFGRRPIPPASNGFSHPPFICLHLVR